MSFARRSLLVLAFAFALAGMLVLAPAAWAQSNPLDFFRQLFAPRSAPAPVLLPPTRLDDAPVRPRPRPQRPTDASAQDIAKASLFVHVVGDALAEMLAVGLRDVFSDRSDVAILRKTRSASGLVREDYFDWPKTLRDMVALSDRALDRARREPGTPEAAGKPGEAAHDRIDVLVVMLGSNDRQPFRDETGSHEPRSERWKDLYVARLDEFLAVVKGRGIPVVWVGLPIMSSPRLTADMLALNELLRDRVTRAGHVYVDIWEGFADEEGEYAASGPDIGGEIVRLRSADGIQFTRAGGRKLAFFAEKEISRLLRLGGARTLDASLLPPDVNEQIRREQPSFVQPDLQRALGLPDIDPLDIPLAVNRPLQGQTVALTAPPLARDGVLARGPLPIATGAAGVERDQMLIWGRPPSPKPGRADHFPWPRQPR